MSDIGDQKVLQIECRDRLGQLTDPTLVKVWVKKPGDAQGVLVANNRISIGLFEALYPITVKGTHLWRVETTGAITGAEEREFEVEEQKVPHA